MSNELPQFDLEVIQNFVFDQFLSDEALETLSFRMRRFPGFPGLRGSYQQKVQGLVEYYDLQGIMPVLFNILAEERPFVQEKVREIGWDGGTITDPMEWLNAGKPYNPTTTDTPENNTPSISANPTSTEPEVDETVVADDALEYVDFNIAITSRGVEGEYTITANSIYGKTPTESVQTMPTNDEFIDAVEFLRTLDGIEEDAITLGKLLYKFLFPETVQRLYDKHKTRAEEQGKEGLRVLIEMTPSIIELTHYPWEYCHDGNAFIAIDGDTPFVRYVRTDRPDTSLDITDKVRLLVVLSSPSDMRTLQVEEEQTRIEDALEELIADGKVELKILSEKENGSPVILRDFRKTVKRFKPHIIHFSGHGKIDNDDDEGGIVIQERDGTAALLDSSALHAIFRTSDDLRLVVLSACQTAQEGTNKEKQRVDNFKGVATRLVDAGIQAVVAMQFEVKEETAENIMRDFYEELADGQPVDVALTEARLSVYADSKSRPFFAIPVLYMSSTNGKIW